MGKRCGPIVVCGVLLGACSSAPGERDTAPGTTGLSTTSPVATGSEGGDTTGAGSATSQVGPTSSASGGEETDEGLDGPVTFDLGPIPDAPPLQQGCTKVDFLFAIDNSGSMSAQQAQLLGSFNGFITAIQDSLETVDSYHVGVITSDAYSGNAAGCMTLGDLVTQTDAGGVCTPFAEGMRFATDADDLATKFPCMAQVGTSGSGIEQPVTGTIAALGADKAMPGACNEGFLRDDAILVVVVLTDDPPYEADVDDAHSSTDTTGWYDAIVAAKGGDPEALVVIGFVPWGDVSCVVFNVESPNLIGFVQSFGAQGVLASICEPDFGPVFAETVSTIVQTCENFDPPG